MKWFCLGQVQIVCHKLKGLKNFNEAIGKELTYFQSWVYESCLFSLCFTVDLQLNTKLVFIFNDNRKEERINKKTYFCFIRSNLSCCFFFLMKRNLINSTVSVQWRLNLTLSNYSYNMKYFQATFIFSVI